MAVGRIPDEAGSDAGYLLEQIRFLTKEYELKVKSKKSISTNILANLLRSLAQRFATFNVRFQKPDNIGAQPKCGNGIFGSFRGY